MNKVTLAGRRRERGSWRPEGPPWVASAGLAALLVGSVLPVGSVHWSVICAVCGLGCVGTALGARELGQSWNPVATVCALLALWTALTLVPLPPAFIQALSGANAQIWSDALSQVLSPSGTWVSLSLDPTASQLEVAKWCLYACAALLGAHVAQTRNLSFVLSVIWGSALLVAVVTMFQALAGMSTVLGIYQPQGEAGRVAPSVLVNPNNLAGYCNLGVFCGVGLLVASSRPVPRPAVWLGVIICAATTLFSASRGGIIGLTMGLAALALHWGLRNLRRQGRLDEQFELVRWVPALAAILLTAAIVAVGGTSALWRELLSDDFSKLRETATVLPALKDHYLVGVGRGAFETVAYRYFHDAPFAVHRSIENFAASWAIEWGVPVALAALLRFAWLLRPARVRLGPHRSAHAAYVGLLALLGQNLLDLGLEVLSVTVVAFSLFGALEGSRSHRVATRSTRISGEFLALGVRPGALASRVVPLLGMAAAVAAASSGPSIFELRPALNREIDAMIAQGGPMTAVTARLAPEIKKRPAEYYFPLLGAKAALALNEDALPWAAAALERAPWNGKTHFMVAEALRQRGALEQAMVNFRHAASGDPRLIDMVGKHVAKLTDDPTLILRATPAQHAGRFLLAVRSQLKPDQASLQRTLLTEASRRAPEDPAVQSALGFELLSDLRRNHVPCDDPSQRCSLEHPERIEAQVSEIASRLKDHPQCNGVRIEGQLRASKGDLAGANDLLRACNRCIDPVPCARERVSIAVQLDDPSARREAENAYLSLACSLPESCAEGEKFVGDLSAKRGDWLGAHVHYVRAASRDPSRQNWAAATRAALRAGQIVQAQVAYEHVQKLGGKDHQLDALLIKARRDANTIPGSAPGFFP